MLFILGIKNVEASIAQIPSQKCAFTAYTSSVLIRYFKDSDNVENLNMYFLSEKCTFLVSETQKANNSHISISKFINGRQTPLDENEGTKKLEAFLRIRELVVNSFTHKSFKNYITNRREFLFNNEGIFEL